MNTLSSLLKFIANSIAPIISNQTAKKVLAAPNGATGKPSFRELGASDITSGEFATARIPNLDASKINSGALNASRIPELDASKVTSGVFATDRIPNLDVSKVSGALSTENLVWHTWTKDNVVVDDTSDYITVDADLGLTYSLIGVVAVWFSNATNSGTNASTIALRGYTFNSTGKTITAYVRKMTSANAKIKINVTGLYKK